MPATLALTLGAPATFGAFTPGVAKTYTASTTANVISTAGDATLSVADPSATATGHLVNGAFSLPQPLQAAATQRRRHRRRSAPSAARRSPLTLLTYTGPVVQRRGRRSSSRSTIGATDAAAHGHVQQDADVHAEHHDSVASSSRLAPRCGFRSTPGVCHVDPITRLKPDALGLRTLARVAHEGCTTWMVVRARRRRVVSGCAGGLAAGPAAHAAGVGRDVDQLAAGGRQGRQPDRRRSPTKATAPPAPTVSVRVMRRGTGGALIGKTSVDVAAHGTKSFLVGVKVPEPEEGHLLRRRVHAAGRRRQGRARLRHERRGPQDQGRRPGARQARADGSSRRQGKARAAQAAVHARRAHARPSRATACGPSSATAATRASTATSSSVYDARHQQVPAGHARRADAEVDAVPERVQPRLRPPGASISQHGGRPGLGHDDPVDHDRRRPGDVLHVQPTLPGQPERPGRSRPARPRRLEHEPGQRDQPEPAGLRAGRQQRGASRTCRAVRPSS